MFIEGFGLAGYTSFGDKVQKLGPFRKINLFIGQNNSGKSNLLLFLKRRFEQFITSINSDSPSDFGFSALEFSQIVNPPQIEFLIGLDRKGGKYHDLLERLNLNHARHSDLHKYLEAVLGSKTLSQGTDLGWFPYSTRGQRPELRGSLV
jgi:predicted ATP-dependent endonuclease of OLD family